jgi:hypothetical protein
MTLNKTLTDMVDWSIEGSGSASESGVESTSYCGPHSEPPYARFEAGIAFDIENAVYRKEYSSAFSLIEPQPQTMEITNCERITVGLKDLEVNFELPLDYIDQLDKIIINGVVFNRERSN